VGRPAKSDKTSACSFSAPLEVRKGREEEEEKEDEEEGAFAQERGVQAASGSIFEPVSKPFHW
jgi:hypothetical protein